MDRVEGLLIQEGLNDNNYSVDPVTIPTVPIECTCSSGSAADSNTREQNIDQSRTGAKNLRKKIGEQEDPIANENSPSC